jgi:hypothetical protein
MAEPDRVILSHLGSHYLGGIPNIAPQIIVPQNHVVHCGADGAPLNLNWIARCVLVRATSNLDQP